MFLYYLFNIKLYQIEIRDKLNSNKWQFKLEKID